MLESNGLVEGVLGLGFLFPFFETGLNKQKKISGAERSLFFNCLCKPSVFTGNLEMKTEDEVDFLKGHEERAVREAAVSATDVLCVTLPFSMLFKELPPLLWLAA